MSALHQQKDNCQEGRREHISTIVFSPILTPLPSLQRAFREISFGGAEELNHKLLQLYSEDYYNGNRYSSDEFCCGNGYDTAGDEPESTICDEPDPSSGDLGDAVDIAGWQHGDATDKEHAIGVIHFEESSIESFLVEAMPQRNKKSRVSRCINTFFYSKRRRRANSRIPTSRCAKLKT
jgi:hypothetical protein